MTVSDNSVPRDVPPFRADHVGSFLRPESVRKARLEAQQGLISPEELRLEPAEDVFSYFCLCLRTEWLFS